MSNFIQSVLGIIGAEATATYIVGALAILGVYWQLTKNFRLNKQSNVFEDLSKQIQEAIKLLRSIDIETQTLITDLANQADLASTYQSDEVISRNDVKEIDRRLQAINEIATSHRRSVDTIYSSYEKVLYLIESVEKSTIISNDSKTAARYLYYASSDQHNLIRASSDVLITFEVIPIVNELPKITPQTFKAFADLLTVINAGNATIRSYLEDFEVILHNDLVKGIYGKAPYSEQHSRYLTASGLRDKRTRKSLI